MPKKKKKKTKAEKIAERERKEDERRLELIKEQRTPTESEKFLFSPAGRELRTTSKFEIAKRLARRKAEEFKEREKEEARKELEGGERVWVRPKDAPPEEDILLTGLTEEEQEKVRRGIQLEEGVEKLGAVEDVEKEPLPSEMPGGGFFEQKLKGSFEGGFYREFKEGEAPTLGESLKAGAVAASIMVPGAAALKVGKAGLSMIVGGRTIATKAATTRIATTSAARINQAGILARLWQSKIGKAVITIGASQGLIEAYASALDGANMQMKEKLIEGIVANVRIGGYGPNSAVVGMGKVREVEDNVNINEGTIKLLEIFSLRARFLAKFEPIKERIGKVREEISEAKQLIKILAAKPPTPDQEQLAITAEEIKRREEIL